MPLEHLPDGRIRMRRGDYNLPWMTEKELEQMSVNEEWADRVAAAQLQVGRGYGTQARPNAPSQTADAKRLDAVTEQLADAFCIAEGVLRDAVALNDRLFGATPEADGEARCRPVRDGAVGKIADHIDSLRDVLVRLESAVRRTAELV